MVMYDYNDFQARQAGLRRRVTLEFSEVIEGDLLFHFLIEGICIASIRKDSLAIKQREFFSAISTPQDTRTSLPAKIS